MGAAIFVWDARGKKFDPQESLAVLQEHVKSVSAPYKYQREIEFVPDLPKTISGKIRRTELRQMERERSKRRTPSAPRGETTG